jgi:hypothetical protein
MNIEVGTGFRKLTDKILVPLKSSMVQSSTAIRCRPVDISATLKKSPCLCSIS